jgi:hypothetical protein
LKTTQGKAIRNNILETYPNIKDYLDDLWPKKAAVMENKLKG